MRYQSALVLSTLTVGLAAAGPNNNRHASFHARRSAAVASPDNVAWKNVARDAVDYKAATDKITDAEWKQIFANPGAGAQPEASAQPKAPAQPTADAQPEVKAQYEPSPAAGGDLLKTLGITGGAKNDMIWEGTDPINSVTFTNDDSEQDVAIICWNEDPAIKWSIKTLALTALVITAGGQKTLGFAQGLSGACAPMYADTPWSFSSLPKQTLYEFTTSVKGGQHGVFDISREVNMSGNVVTATGSLCTSGVKDGQLSCVFGCTSAGNDCLTTYALLAGAEHNNDKCNIGKDDQTHDPSGGCQMDPNGDHIQVTFSRDTNWPTGDFSA